MAKERLSKLQKWILNRAIENFKERCEKEGRDKGTPYVYREEIFRDYYNWKSDPRDMPQKFRVSASRSLKRLEERGFVKVLSWRGCFILYTPEYCKFIMKLAKEKREKP